MSQNSRHALVLGIALSLGPAAAAAQQAGMLVLEAPSSVQTMAYGNAPYLYTTSPALLFEAPGLIERADGVLASYQRYGSEGTLASIAGAGSALGGGFAVGVQYMRYGLDGGFPVERDLQSVALTDGEIGVTEFVGSIGYARTLFGVRTGAVLKYAEQSANRARDGNVAFDVGLAKEVGPVVLALTGRNLGGDLRLSPAPAGTQEAELELPTQWVAGVSLEEFQVGPLDMHVTSQVARRRDGQYIPAGGVEVSYWPVVGYTFRLRGGLQRVYEDDRSPFTFGAEFTADDIGIEYAFQSFDGEGNAHRFGLRWR